jgi:hypothetical protein
MSKNLDRTTSPLITVPESIPSHAEIKMRSYKSLQICVTSIDGRRGSILTAHTCNGSGLSMG